MLIGGKFIYKKYPLQDLLSNLNAVISANESTEFITGHVIYNPAYTSEYLVSTTLNLVHTLLLKSKMTESSSTKPEKFQAG